MKCKNCCVENETGNKFCRNCGNNLQEVILCQNCGAGLDQISKFCTSCGHSVHDVRLEQPAKEASATAETEVKGSIKKRMPPKWIISAIVIVIVILGTTTYAFNLLKSPKSLYLLSEYNTFKQLKSDWAEVYGEQYEFQKMLLEKPSSNQLKITGNIELPEDAMNSETAIVQEVLSKVAIMINSEQDIKNNVNKVNMGLQMDGANTLDFNIYQSPNLIGVSVPVLYDKAFYLNTNQFGQFMRNLDSSYEGPEKLELNKLDWNKLRLTEEELKALSKRYGKFLVENLDEKNFSIKKGVSYDYNGETLKLREITLTLTPKETEVFIKALLDQLIQDEELHSMIADRLALVGESYQFAQHDEGLTDPEQIKADVRDSLKDMKAGLDEISFPEGFKSVILIDKKEQIVDSTNEFTIGNDNENVAFNVSGKNIPYETSNHFREWKVEVIPESDQKSKLTLSASNDIQNENKQRVEDMNVKFYLKDSSDVLADIALNLRSDFQEYQNGKLDVTRDFDLKLNGSDYYGPIHAVSGTLTEKSETNLKKLTSNQKLNFAITFDDDNESGKLKLGFDSKSAIKEDLKITPLNTKDGVNVAEIKESDIYDIQEEIGNRFINLLDELGLNEEMSYQNDSSLFDESYSNAGDYDNNNYASYYDKSGSELFAQSCASCHGQNLEGGVGPDLQTVGSRLSPGEVSDIIAYGRNAMPAGLLQEDDARKVAEWLTENYNAQQYGYEEDNYTVADANIDGDSSFAKSCAACHGQNLEGGVGPSLDTVSSRLSTDEVYSVIVNGRGAMPAGLVDEQTARAIADWLTTDYD